MLQGFKTTGRSRSRLYSAQSRSIPPLSTSEIPESDHLLAPSGVPITSDIIEEEHDSMDDEVFFDNEMHATSALDLREPVQVPAPVEAKLRGAGEAPTTIGYVG